jgi:hypothetical protein
VLIAQQNTLPAAEAGFPDTVRVLEWNISLAPGSSQSGPRTELMAEALAGFNADVIIFNEAFPAGKRYGIKNALGGRMPYETGNPATQKGRTTNSGVWMISKFPITNVEHMIYSDCGGPDCNTAMGATIAEINVGGRTMQIIGTQLQDNTGGADFHSVRTNQLTELKKEMLDEFARPGVPQIIAGDLATDFYSERKNYDGMLAALDAKDEAPSCHCYTFTSRNEIVSAVGSASTNRLPDYILFRPQNTTAAISERQVVNFRFMNAKKKDPSDHYALLGKMVWNDEVATTGQK